MDRVLFDALVDVVYCVLIVFNVVYWYVMVVDDLCVIEVVWLILLLLQLRPLVLIVLLIDFELVIDCVGSIGAFVALIDSGAVGENVWLVVTVFGFGI